jgi:UDP-2,4-diacetamido-2,4,6-trideoxy-beta-L-altropyranose hydrolase
MSIYIRVDSNADIGLGHVTRCLALADMLSSNFPIKFICKYIDKKSCETIKLAGFELIRIRIEEEIFSLIKAQDIVVLDHYGLTSSYQETIKRYGCKLVCIDDISNDEFFADVIINTAPHVSAEYYKAQRYTQYALGPDYALLRAAFLEAAREVKILRNVIQSAFVCFGGSDRKNLSVFVAKVLLADSRFKSINIVVGSEYIFYDELEKLSLNDERINVFIQLEPDEMVRLIKSCDLAIVPASGILTEVIAVGSRIVSGTYIYNQKNFFEGYKVLGAFESANEFANDDLKNAIDKCFTFDNRPLAHIIDGKSKDRITKIFSQFTLKDSITLVKADFNHLDATFRWATDPRVRMFSPNRHQINLEEHTTWFLRSISDPNCFYYLAQLGDNLIGSVRYNVEGEEAIISYLVDPMYSNQGIGMLLLNLGLDKLKYDSLVGLKKVSGYVLPQNVASMKSFERLGYKLSHDRDMFKYTKFIE